MEFPSMDSATERGEDELYRNHFDFNITPVGVAWRELIAKGLPPTPPIRRGRALAPVCVLTEAFVTRKKGLWYCKKVSC